MTRQKESAKKTPRRKKEGGREKKEGERKEVQTMLKKSMAVMSAKLKQKP